MAGIREVNPPAENHTRELFRESTGDPAGSHYENHVYLDEDGRIAMSVGGRVVALPIKGWMELWSALSEIDNMNPNDFRTGQDHLPLAFREINFHDAMLHVQRIVNKVLHNTSEYGEPLDG